MSNNCGFRLIIWPRVAWPCPVTSRDTASSAPIAWLIAPRIRGRTEREGPQGRVNAARCRRSVRLIQGVDRFRDDRFEGFRTMRDNLTLGEPPPDTLLKEAGVDRRREPILVIPATAGLYPPRFCYVPVDCLHKVVDPEPGARVAIVDEVVYFAPDVLIAPIARVGANPQHAAQNSPDALRRPVQGPHRFHHGDAQALRSSFADRDFRGISNVLVAPRERFIAHVQDRTPLRKKGQRRAWRLCRHAARAACARRIVARSSDTYEPSGSACLLWRGTAQVTTLASLEGYFRPPLLPGWIPLTRGRQPERYQVHTRPRTPRIAVALEWA